MSEMKHPAFTIVLENGGELKGELYPEYAPQAVGNFIALANGGFYDGLTFHRVIPGFMIQGGCPKGTGTGGPGYHIKGEFSQNGVKNPLKHTYGVLSMARAAHPDSAGSQFFIMTSDSPHLDGGYAAFGKVIEGMEADVPDAMIENQINSIVQEYDGNLRQQGLNLETYLQFTGSDMEKFRSTFRETAEKTVKSRLALEEIVKAEKIVVDEEEIEAEYKRMSEQYEVDLEQIKNFIPSERLAEDIAVDKALKYVMANAKITTKRATKA